MDTGAVGFKVTKRTISQSDAIPIDTQTHRHTYTYKDTTQK